uniref:Uncharacterized protein n=1 Tax=viral metagenome TaxID=1070528 RepID=A0A6M3LP77_9ZZZZ
MNNGLNGREDEMSKDLAGEDIKEQKQPEVNPFPSPSDRFPASDEMSAYIHHLNLVLQSWDDPESAM